MGEKGSTPIGGELGGKIKKNFVTVTATPQELHHLGNVVHNCVKIVVLVLVVLWGAGGKGPGPTVFSKIIDVLS